MRDEIVRTMTKDGFVKASAIRSTAMVERARQIHQTAPTATVALGRALTGASMMGNLQKVENGSVTLQWRGGGPLGSVLAVSDAVGNTRGYVQNPQAPALEVGDGLSVGAAVGRNGTLTVIRDLQMKEPYVGSIQLVSGEIAEDITAYFAQSEQIPTACALGVLTGDDESVTAAGGYLIQLLPGAPDDVIDRVEAGIRAAGSVTAALRAGAAAEEVLRLVLHDFALEKLDCVPVSYRCYCSRQRVTDALRLLGREELQQIVQEGKPTKVGCQFCDQSYTFTPEDVKRILEHL